MAELEKLGQRYRVALRYVPNFGTSSISLLEGLKLLDVHMHDLL